MSTNFPASLDTLANPAATDGLTGHASQHANANDAIEALEAKVGVDNSTDPASLDYRVATLESGGGGGIWGSITGALSDQTDLQAALNGKLSASATTDAIAEGSSNLYFTAARVRDAVLTGLSTATNAVIAATDSVLTAFGKLQAQISGHTSSTANPHSVTKTQVGLGNVDNTSDLNKPVSTAQAAAFVGKTSATGSAQLPAGTTGERDSSPTEGLIRFNTTTKQFEGYFNGAWHGGQFGSVTQADLAANVAGNGPAFSAGCIAGVSHTGDSWSLVPFQLEDFDTASAYDSVASYKFSPKVAGYYLITGTVQLLQTGTLITAVFKNGSLYKVGGYGGTITSAAPQATITALVYLNGSTDYVQIYTNPSSTGNTNPVVSNTFFQGFLARAA